MTQNQDEKSLTIFLGSLTEPRNSPTNQCDEEGSWSTMAVGSQSSTSRRCHQVQRCLCLGDIIICEMIQFKRTIVETSSVAPEGAVLSNPLFLYFGAEVLNIICCLMVWLPSSRGTPKYRLCLGSALLCISFTIIILFMLSPRLYFAKTHRRSHPVSSKDESSGIPYRCAPTPLMLSHHSLILPPFTPSHQRPSRVTKFIQIVHDQQTVKPCHSVHPPI